MDIIAILRGLVLNPRLVAGARGLLEAGIMAVILLASDATFLNSTLPDGLHALIPTIVLALRFAEGHMDAIDPSKQRRRDALRQEGAAAEITAGAAGPLDPGDVKDPGVDAMVSGYNNGDMP